MANNRTVEDGGGGWRSVEVVRGAAVTSTNLHNLHQPPHAAGRRRVLDLQGLLVGGCVSKLSTPRGCSSAGRAPGSHPGGQGFEPPQLHARCQSSDVRPQGVLEADIGRECPGITGILMSDI